MSIDNRNQIPTELNNALDKLQTTIDNKKWFVPTNAINKALDDVKTTFASLSSNSLSNTALQQLTTRIHKLANSKIPPVRISLIEKIFTRIFGAPQQSSSNGTVGDNQAFSAKLHGLMDNYTPQTAESAKQQKTPVQGAKNSQKKPSSQTSKAQRLKVDTNSSLQPDPFTELPSTPITQPNNKLTQAQQKQIADNQKTRTPLAASKPAQPPTPANSTAVKASNAKSEIPLSKEETSLLNFLQEKHRDRKTEILEEIHQFPPEQQPLLCAEIQAQLQDVQSDDQIPTVRSKTVELYQELQRLNTLKKTKNSLKFFSVDGKNPATKDELTAQRTKIFKQVHPDKAPIKLKTEALKNLAIDLQKYCQDNYTIAKSELLNIATR